MRDIDESRIRAADDDTVRALYEACAGVTPWRVALEAANEALGARIAQLVTVDSRTRHPLAVAEAGDDDAPSVDAAKRFDDQLRVLATHRTGEAVAIASAPAESGARGASLIAGKVREHRRSMTFVTFARPRRPFSATEFTHAARYIAHLATAMKVTQHCEDVQHIAKVGERIIHTSARPMLLLGASRELLAANAPARALLRAGDLVRVRRGVLECVDAANDATLAKVIERFLGDRGRHERRQRAAAKLDRAAGAPMLCSVSNMMPEERAGLGDEHPVALLAFWSLEVAETQMDGAFLSSLYNFTPAELRVVASLLRGEDLVQIAARNEISLATVRTQLKSVFAKTNTHRQAQVVQLLLTALLV